MEVAAIAALQRFSAEKMQKINLFETGRMFCDIYCLEPGQSQKPHAHAGADKVYFVLEGEGEFSVGEERRSLAAGHAILAPAEVNHGVRNATGERLTDLVFMAPKPNVPSP
jgi:quercetin dioxygenase-like cupin family protein